MMSTFAVDPRDPEAWEPALAAASDALAAGALVILPTETVYGIAARPDVPGATERLFAVKRRQATSNLPVLCAASTEALGLTRAVGPGPARLARALWPGSLTLVLPRSRRSKGWPLGQGDDTIGVRVPSHPVAAALLRRTGPLAVSSANLSGQPPLATPEDLTEAFGREVAVYLLSGPVGLAGLASTVVDLTGAAPSVIREGPIAVDRIFDLLGDRRPPRGGTGAG